MKIIENLFLLLGGIGVFLTGLKLMSENVGGLAGNKMSKIVKAGTKNRVSALLIGASVTAVLQSSIATNMIAIAFVQKGILSFVSASAIMLGTNVGTTITAQLVSFSTVSDFEISAIGCLIAFLGFCCSLFKSKNIKMAGGALFGFGLIFIGLKLMTESVECFKSYSWFTNLFLVKNPLLLLLNGFLITCVFQSSSVVTSILIVLVSLGLVDFYSSLFIVLGTNVGTCLPVVFSTVNYGYECKKSAVFNLAFNVFGVLIYFPLIYLGYDLISPVLNASVASVGRNVANFHTLFNLSVSVIVLPVLKPFCSLINKICDFIFAPENLKQSSCENSRQNSRLNKKQTKTTKTSVC